MAERDRQLRRDVDVEVDVSGESLEEPSATDDSGLGTRVRERAGTVLSARTLLATLVLTVAGMVIVGQLLPLGSIGGLLGVLLATFSVGVGSETRHYTESGIAGTVAGGGSALLGNLVLSVLGVGLPLVVLGAAAGGVAGLVGHYLGRDLRDGLTREL